MIVAKDFENDQSFWDFAVVQPCNQHVFTSILQNFGCIIWSFFVHLIEKCHSTDSQLKIWLYNQLFPLIITDNIEKIGRGPRYYIGGNREISFDLDWHWSPLFNNIFIFLSLFLDMNMKNEYAIKKYCINNKDGLVITLHIDHCIVFCWWIWFENLNHHQSLHKVNLLT